MTEQAHPRAIAGFTLVELMVVISIGAILLSIGVPSYRSVTTSSRVSAEINALLSDMQFARSQALREGQPFTACISTDGASCTGGNQWQGGWIVFSDPNGNATVDGDDAVLRVRRRFEGADDFAARDGRDSVTFNRAGFALNVPVAGALLTLHDATSNAAHTRCLSISMTGMMATQSHLTAPETCT